jgi:phage terminase Nu1 subunit (DNA packaging protein)
MPIDLISPAEYARRRGLTRAAVSKGIRRCGIPLTEGKLDPIVADAAWQARTDPEQARRALAQRKAGKEMAQTGANSTQPPSAPPADPPAGTWRERRDRAQAKLAELKVREREGQLLDVTQARREFWDLFYGVTGLLDAFPARVGHELAGKDEQTIHHLLADAIYKLRTDIVETWTDRLRSGLMSEAIRAMQPLNGQKRGDR